MITRDPTSIDRYSFFKGSTTARTALRLGRDIKLLYVVRVNDHLEPRVDPSDVKTALKWMNDPDVVSNCQVSKSDPEETSWELIRPLIGGDIMVFTSKSMPEIKAALKAGRKKG